jgi:hypothetical protein
MGCWRRAWGTLLEHARVSWHLACTEQRLRQASVVLDLHRQARRQRSLDLLHEYWRRGEFPHNSKASGPRRPALRDQEGRWCAVAYLAVHTGQASLVERLVATHNHAAFLEVADPSLTAWLCDWGLRPPEAAAIQPFYGTIEGGHFALPLLNSMLTWLVLWLSACSGVVLGGTLLLRRWARSWRGWVAGLLLLGLGSLLGGTFAVDTLHGRLVQDPAAYSCRLTPVGGSATVELAGDPRCFSPLYLQRGAPSAYLSLIERLVGPPFNRAS